MENTIRKITKKYERIRTQALSIFKLESNNSVTPIFKPSECPSACDVFRCFTPTILWPFMSRSEDLGFLFPFCFIVWCLLWAGVLLKGKSGLTAWWVKRSTKDERPRVSIEQGSLTVCSSKSSSQWVITTRWRCRNRDTALSNHAE